MRYLSLIALLALLSAIAFGQATQPAPATSPTTAPIAPADAILKSLLKPTTPAEQVIQPIKDAPLTDATSGQAAVAPNAPTLPLVREGTFVTNRLGRLTRTADNQWEFTFESDAKTLQDPPMLLLPNLQLMALEKEATSSGRDLQFRVTGMVTEYRGRNYLLLEKVTIVPANIQRF